MTHAYDEPLPVRVLRESMAKLARPAAAAPPVEWNAYYRTQSQMIQIASMWAANHAFASAVIAADETRQAMERNR